MEFLNYVGLKEYNKKIQAQLSKISIDPSELVSNSTKELFNLPITATLDDVLKAINNSIHYEQSGKVAIYITAKTPSGAPIPDAMITGVETLSGQPVFTDASGTAIGYATLSSGSATLSIKNHVDLNDVSVNSSVNNSIHSAALTTTTRNFLSIESSASYYCSGLLKRIDVSCGGGGGGAAGGNEGVKIRGSSGGGGGYAVASENVSFLTRHEYLAAVGASGGGGTGYNGRTQSSPTNGKSGGTSSFLGLSAAGGSGGSVSDSDTRAPGNGTGGVTSKANASSTDIARRKPAGTAGTGYVYSSMTSTTAWGGGGGAGSSDYTVASPYTAFITRGTGGSPGGGNGGYLRRYNSNGSYDGTTVSASEGKNGGGGGGMPCSSSNSSSDTTTNGGDGQPGGAGKIAVRMYF